MATALERLEALGNTADEVAESLRKLGVKGRKGNCDECPLAMLTNCSVTPDFVLDIVACKQWETPPACRRFVFNFDQGEYPDLVESPTE